MRALRIRPRLELLEARDCPSVTAGVSAGNLLVKADTSTANLVVAETASGAFQVSLNGQTVGSFTGVSGGLHVELSNKDNTGVIINLGGFSTLKDLSVGLGNGSNDLTIENGGIAGKLSVTGGREQDQLALGGDGKSLSVLRETTVHFGGATTDQLTINSAVHLLGDLNVQGVENIAVDAGSEVGGNVKIQGGRTNSVLFGGQVDGNLSFTGGRGDDSLTLAAGASIDGTLTVEGKSGADSIDLEGSVGRDVSISSAAWGGSKDVQLDGTFERDVAVHLGNGSDTVEFTGTILGNLSVKTGSAADMVVFDSTSKVGNANVSLGGGNDSFLINKGAAATGVDRIYGGAHTGTGPGNVVISTYSTLPANVHLYGFQTIDLGL